MIDCMAMTMIWIYSSVSDLKNYRIPNYIVVGGWLAGIGWRYSVQGIMGVCRGIGVILISLLIAWMAYLVHAMGAGDLKLWTVIGAFYPLSFSLRVAVVWIFLAGAAALIRLCRIGCGKARFQYLFQYLLYDRKGAYYVPERDGRQMVLPMAPFLAVTYYIVYMFTALL